MAKLTKDEIISSFKEMTILELNEVVEAMKEEFGVDPSAVAVAGPVAAAVEEGPSKVNVVLTAAGANKINSLEFGIRNSEPLKNAALKNAISDARSKAEVIADSLGVKIIGIKSVSESVINIHNRDYANSVMNMSMKETSIAPGTMEFNANVVIEFVIK